MKFIFFILFCLITLHVNGQNFPNGAFTYSSSSYTVLPTATRLIIYNNSNPQVIRTKPLDRTRKINYDKLQADIVNNIKSVVTPQQLLTLQQEKFIAMPFYIDNTGKINIIERFNVSSQTCLTPSNIYNIEIGLKNIVVQFQDSLPPEAGALSIIIPAKMFR